MRQNSGMAFSGNKLFLPQLMPSNLQPVKTELVIIVMVSTIRNFLSCLFAFALLLLSVSCTSNTSTTPEITVFAASSLTDALQEMATVFRARYPDTTIIFNFAGSSQLAVQLIEGVPADLFASANPTQMQNVVEAGRITADSVHPFATNQLTLIVPTDNPGHIMRLTDLSQPNLRLILAVPGVPVRQYTDEVVAKLGTDFANNFYKNVVSEEENVRQVVAKIALGEADAALVYASDITPDIAQQVQQILIPAEQNIIATYLIAPIANSSQPELAQQFNNFILSPEGQAILSQWGFAPLRSGN